MKVSPIIIAGGSGTRLWPLSRSNYPKQFLTLEGELSLLQSLAKSLQHKLFNAPLLMCNEDHRFIVSEQLRLIDVKPQEIVLEPSLRNTAPAIAVACLLQNAKDNIVLILPSDHVIRPYEKFIETVQDSLVLAESGHIVLFGITPDQPSPDYGYIQAKNTTDLTTGFKIEKFIEKPTKDNAAELLKQKGMFWNSGIFLSKASVLLEELKKFSPNIVTQTQKSVKDSRKDLDFIRLDASSYSNAECISIDYAVMEKSNKTCVVPAAFEWSDLGSWKSLYDFKAKNTEGNVIKGDVITHNVKNSFIEGEGILVSAIGIENLVVVACPDSVLVVDQAHTHQVKEITTQLKNNNRSQADSHSKVYRPWGFYQVTDMGERFQVKRLMIKPGQETSIQIHHHRSEHWVVVNGVAKVLKGEETLLVHENESVYLPMGVKHRVSNPGKIELHLVEVQTGSYLGEDDIVRLDDAYGRHTKSA
ncbi:mannose-1-phosphate guanylyltransferase/mannose-6-phosphate isomerase [Candidatus Nucleicultrix amoebiphila]|jgi:mannose-1-phosphate guanylyltransferase/mannose-6-phosphate isomerase|uniref:mannose-1-phosphate guanylyltransferase n=1 Tax=Candidatus Nucleicultrix amoebiphila FS5 TaxID=1414854 RepID=A0A1W6N467_9PROT|nr:mannose-1-phosphate guanylyltransferase/mannose-6-phosphate isomerase [Candidatus Nucleicultrix amoebiphila]ARN84561.1 hypothetical protein GQ61_03675 [Candidatus Nucleicultrix amoebiphila FS5]